MAKVKQLRSRRIELTFCLSDCVADGGADVMLAVLGKDQGQAGRGGVRKPFGLSLNTTTIPLMLGEI